MIFGRDLDIEIKGQAMPSTVLDRWVATVSLALAAGLSLAKDVPPHILQEPIFGLRVDAANPALEVLPAQERNKCVEIADNEYLTARIWVFAVARDADATYYLVGGYFKRSHPEAGEPRYRPDTLGGVYRIAGGRCTGIGAAREVFAVRALDETPQPILQQLANDLSARLGRAYGGPAQLRAELRKQRAVLRDMPPEIQEAFKPYLGP